MPRQKKSKASPPTLKQARNEIVVAMAEDNLTPRLYNRILQPAHVESILQHVAAGATVSAICEALGVASGLVYQRAYDDPAGFGKRLKAAREIGTYTQVDSMLTIANDDSESVERSKLKIATLQWLAKHHLSTVYGDKPLIDARQLHITVSKDDLDLC